MDAQDPERDARIRELSRKLVSAHEKYLARMRELRMQQADLLKRVLARINREAIDRVRAEINSIDKP